MSATVAHSDKIVAVRGTARAAVLLSLLAGAGLGFAVGARTAPGSDAELMGLLRAMAVLKLTFVAAVAAGVWWRLQAPVRPAWLAAYAVVCAAMAAGPPLIWFSSHIILASVLLHAGLAAGFVLLWQDGVAADLLREAVRRRRSVSHG